MATSDAVNEVLGKLADGTLKEVLFLYDGGHKMEKVCCDLNWIKFLIWDADSLNIGDESRMNWRRKFEDVAYQLHSLISLIKTSEMKVPKEIQSRGYIRSGKMERMFRKPKKLPLTDKLRDKINQIQVRVQQISQGIKAIKNLSEPNSAGMGLPASPPSESEISDIDQGSEWRLTLPMRLPAIPPIESEISDIDEGSECRERVPVRPKMSDYNVVGLDTDKREIVKLLLDENTTRRSVISIMGPGGVGKTTLARLAYNSTDVKRQFDLRMWVTVSQSFHLTDLLREIMSQIQSHDPREQEEKGYLIIKLSQFLSGKRYLIVLDDVWTHSLWTEILAALPDNNIGSRVLMTTRTSDVGKAADPISEPYKLAYLNQESSLELLLSMALPNEESHRLLSDDLLDIAKQFAIRCGGLPLALVTVGSFLSTKEPTYYSWNKVLQTTNQQLNGGYIFDVLAMSYDDLPIDLKSCFMYFASFPRAYEIEAKPLIRMWIAEGLVPCMENETWEDTANCFLEDLVDRSMVQVLRRSPDGSIIACCMHDLMLDLAIQKATENNFLVVCSDTYELIPAGARRVAVHNSNCDELMEYASPNLRSLLLFNSPIPNCSRQRLLKVLMGIGSKMDAEVNFERYKGLPYLQYFELSGQISTNTKKYFNKLLGSMKILQTLDLRRARVCGDLPDIVWHVKTLRHIMLPPYTSGPPSRADLSNLQTLTGVKTRASWETQAIPNLPNIHDLDIQIEQGFPRGVFRSLLSMLQHLLSLKIVSSDIITDIADSSEFSVYTHLQSLSLRSFLITTSPFMLHASLFPRQITELKLENLQLQVDPMPALKELNSLKSLTLGDKTYMGRTMACSAGSFNQLEELIFVGLEMLEEWEIVEGTMPMLKQLSVEHCPRLRVPLGLQHLISLEEVYWNMDLESGSERTKVNVFRKICKHVPSVTVAMD